MLHISDERKQQSFILSVWLLEGNLREYYVFFCIMTFTPKQPWHSQQVVLWRGKRCNINTCDEDRDSLYNIRLQLHVDVADWPR
jgi:hypothetical protein